MNDALPQNPLRFACAPLFLAVCSR